MNKDFLNSLAASNSSRKRKMTEGRETPLPPPPPPGFPTPPHQQPPAPSNLLRLGQPGPSSQPPPPPQPLLPYFDTVLRLSVGPHALTPEQGGGGDMDLMTRPIKSFTSLLNGDGFKEDAPPANLELHKDFIDQAVKCNNDRVRDMLEEMCKRQYAAIASAVEEKAAKKMKEKDEEIEQVRAKNAELENTLASYRNQAMNMGQMLKSLEQTNSTLSAALQEATRRMTTQGEGGGNGVPTQQAREEEAESSSLDPEQVVVVRITCKLCWRGPATMMPWPCRHLCLCSACERSTNRCPICESVFRDCIEVKFY